MFIFKDNGVIKSSETDPRLHPAFKGNVTDIVEVANGQDGELQGAWDIIDNVFIIDLGKAKIIKKKEAQRLASDAMKAITDEYEPHEIATWDIQEAEARGNQPDNYLPVLATNSGIDLATLKAKIITNADAYRNASATAVGKRQKMENACMTAATIDELKAVQF